MSYEMSWYIPKRIILVHVLGELDINQIEEMSKAASALMDDGIAPVHCLLDDAKGGRPPISLKELQARMEISRHPSIGWIIGIGEADPVAKFLIPLLMKVLNVKYTRVATIEDALKFLNKQDMSLKIEAS